MYRLINIQGVIDNVFFGIKLYELLLLLVPAGVQYLTVCRVMRMSGSAATEMLSSILLTSCFKYSLFISD